MAAPIDAVVVHWNQGAACRETVARLQAHPLVGHIVVVDNGSDPEELATVAGAAESDTEIIRLNTNRGFGPATNVGWKRWLTESETEWCVALPHDAYAEDQALAEMLAIGTARPKLGLLSADVGDGMLPIVDRNFGPILRPQDPGDGFQRCDYPHGTMFLARRSCLEDIGLYDERYFTYCEEADLGLRASGAGWDVGMAVGSRVFNPRVSTPRAIAGYLMERNTLLLTAKHFGALPTIVRTALAVWQLARGAVQPSTRDEYWSGKGRLLALRDAALGRWGPPPDLA